MWGFSKPDALCRFVNLRKQFRTLSSQSKNVLKLEWLSFVDKTADGLEDLILTGDENALRTVLKSVSHRSKNKSIAARHLSILKNNGSHCSTSIQEK